MLLCKPSIFAQPIASKTETISRSRNPSRTITISMAPPQQRRRTMSALEARISLVFALASQTSSLSQRRKCFACLLLYSYMNLLKRSVLICLSTSLSVVVDFTTEAAKYFFPKRFETRTLEEALMSGILLCWSLQISWFFGTS